MESERVVVELAAILLLGVGAQWLAWRVKLPSILLLLSLGFLVGPALGWIHPDALLGELLFPFVSLSVAIILFEGGMTLKYSELRHAGRAIFNLMTIGAAVTLLLSTLASKYILGLGWSLSLLLGSILVVTGPTVIGPLLKHVRPLGKVSAIAKWEGIVVDPIGAVLAVLMFQATDAIHNADYREVGEVMLSGTVRTIISGVVVSIAVIAPLIVGIRRFWIPDSLQSPLILVSVFVGFTASNLYQADSGLLTVTLMGLILTNQRWVNIQHIVEFKENLQVLLLSSLFIILAARTTPAELESIDGRTLAFVGALILVVRPVSVWLSTIGQGLRWQERVFLSWFAPRGIVAASVASIFAIELGPSGAPLVPVIFAVVIITVAVYGLTAAPLARWLGLAQSNPQGVLFAGAHSGARAIAAAVKNTGFRCILIDKNPENIRQARFEGFETAFENAIAEEVIDELDLGGIGRFIALTRNDEVNALACMRFREVFGRAELYQLPPERSGVRDKAETPYPGGRHLFRPEATYRYLDARFEDGAVVKSTKLTKEFTYEAFQSLYGSDAVLLFIVADGRLTPVTASATTTPKPGQTIICLVDPIPESSATSSPKVLDPAPT